MSIGHEIFNYEGMYDSDTEQSWRKAGAVDKVSNIQKIVEGLIDLEHLNICEIGCGDSAISQQLSDKKMFRRYQGYEISNSGVKAAKNRKIPNASFQIISPVAGDNKFKKADVVILCHVIEHLENPRELPRLWPFPKGRSRLPGMGCLEGQKPSKTAGESGESPLNEWPCR